MPAPPSSSFPTWLSALASTQAMLVEKVLTSWAHLDIFRPEVIYLL